MPASSASPSAFPDRKDTFTPLALLVILPLLLLTLRPFAEVPRNDDFSYARTALALAQTGQIAYNGWGSPLLLPQAVVGALVIRLAGFSYVALQGVGVASAGVAAALLYLLSRRCGLAQWPALAVVAATTLNPLFLPLAPGFMTDIFSLNLVLLSFLALFAAHHKGQDENLSLPWFAGAVALGLLAGSNRQNGWVAFVGALIPLYLAATKGSRTRLAIIGGGAIVLLGGALLTAWQARQPYNVPIDSLGGLNTLIAYPGIALILVYKLLNMGGLLVLAPGLPVLRVRDVRRPALWVCLLVCLLPLACLTGTRFAAWDDFYGLSQFGQYFTSRGVAVGRMQGLYSPASPTLIAPAVAKLLELGGALGLALAVYAPFALRRDRRDNPDAAPRVGVGPVALAVSALLQIAVSAPFVMQLHANDHYLLAYLPGVAIYLLSVAALRPREARDPDPTRALVGVALAVGGVLAVTGYNFAWAYMGYSRAQATLFHDLRARGVPAAQIDGGLEWNADTQIAAEGHVNNPAMSPPDLLDKTRRGRFLRPQPELFPALDVRYIVSLDPAPSLDFALTPQPVATAQYSILFPPQTRTVSVFAVAPGATDPAPSAPPAP